MSPGYQTIDRLEENDEIKREKKNVRASRSGG
jgi:hypothetical protein